MVKINRFEIENVKRVQVVQVEPAPNGLTIIGGRNGQGKTSILDAILWALGGNKYKPSDPKRHDSSADPKIRIELDNGLVVTRQGKNASLTVHDEQGRKSGQQLLDELIGQLAINLPAFLYAGSKEKAETLLQVIGVGDKLAELDREVEKLYNERHLVGQTCSRKKKHAEDLPYEQGVPDEEVSAGELIRQQQDILAKNGENERLRKRKHALGDIVQKVSAEVDALTVKLEEARKRLVVARDEFKVASKSADDLEDESTTELEASLRKIDELNRRIRINATKRRAEAEASELDEQVTELTEQLEAARARRISLLTSVRLPLDGLSIEAGELTYLGRKWDCMSSSDQLRVGVAIAKQLKPSCQFVLLDKLEQMDATTLTEFGQWLESEGLQAVATRVSVGKECSLIIEDGMVASTAPATTETTTTNEEGF